MTELNELVHRTIELLKTIDRNDLHAYLTRGRLLHELNNAEPWKQGYNGAKNQRQFFASLNISPSAAEKSIRVWARFGNLVNDTTDALPSRLVRALVLDPANDPETLAHANGEAVPETHYKSYLHSKGKSQRPEPGVCDHINCKREYWIKHSCGNWQLDANNKA